MADRRSGGLPSGVLGAPEGAGLRARSPTPDGGGRRRSSGSDAPSKEGVAGRTRGAEASLAKGGGGGGASAELEGGGRKAPPGGGRQAAT